MSDAGDIVVVDDSYLILERIDVETAREMDAAVKAALPADAARSEEHTSELQSPC